MKSALAVLLTLLTPAVVSAAQYARPTSMNSSGSWLAYVASTIPEALDETSPNDSTDYAYETSGNTTMSINLSSVDDPSSSTGHTIRIRGSVSGGSGGPEKYNWVLYDTGGMITSGNNVTLPDDPTWETGVAYTLDTTETDTITDYSTLYVTIEAVWSGGEEGRITWVEFEVPDAPSGGAERDATSRGIARGIGRGVR